MVTLLKTEIIPLSQVEENSTVKIISFSGGTKFRDKLLCQGIIPGQTVEVINTGGFRSPVILKVNDSKIMIGCGMTGRIMVQPV